ncbi:molybdate ABC transporter substrate-binding protein [Amnibacterium endophyticum]|uniref:Molybdate ABC transporter substrate-binding protein n=1 Tax=Amnibacterium endophyticum TaxID=2109337 RepID=A0ABW4LBB7_9MICO
MTARALAALPVALLLVLTGCTGQGTGRQGTGPSATPSSAAPRASTAPPLTGSITVDAAASLNRVLPELATQFERQYPGTSIDFSFGGSSALAAQIVSGAPVDVFAAASTTTMRTVVDAGRTAADPVVIARNRLEIAVPAGNPAGITGLADFADAKRTVVVCAKEVPCGAAAQKAFRLAGVAAEPDSYEPDVTAVLTKVRTGEADAGLVYATDVEAAAGQVEGIAIPQADEALTSYPIAPLTESRNAALAEAWTDFVVSNGGDALQAAGFLAPR